MAAVTVPRWWTLKVDQAVALHGVFELLQEGGVVVLLVDLGVVQVDLSSEFYWEVSLGVGLHGMMPGCLPAVLGDGLLIAVDVAGEGAVRAANEEFLIYKDPGMWSVCFHQFWHRSGLYPILDEDECSRLVVVRGGGRRTV